MAAQDAVARAKFPKFRFRKEPFLRQQNVERNATVAFAEDATVALGPAWIGGVELQNVVVEDAQYFHDGEGRADVSALACLDRAHDHFAQLLGATIENDLVRCDRGNCGSHPLLARASGELFRAGQFGSRRRER